MRIVWRLLRAIEKTVRVLLGVSRHGATYVAPWEATLRDDIALRRPVLLVARILRAVVWLRAWPWFPLLRLRPGATVVIVSWNSVGLIDDTLRAVRRFSPAGTEVLVLDNGSTDGTSAIVRAARDRGEIRAVLLPRNLYHGPAMDLGFLLCRTEIVVALDVDAFPISPTWLDELSGPLLDGDDRAEVVGSAANRGYVHPSCLAMRLAHFAARRHTFSPHEMSNRQLPLVDETWFGSDGADLRWDTGESIARRDGPGRTKTLPRTSARGPGYLGSTFGHIVFHNSASTRLQAGDIVDGITIDDVHRSWAEAVEKHLPPDDLAALPTTRPDDAPGLDLAVIVPVRNVADTIGEQLDALIAQKADQPEGDDLSWEVVVVDNGSTDDTASIVASYTALDPRIRLVKALDHPGVGYARNIGVAATSAPRIAICDGDDVVAPGWVRAISDALDKDPLVSGPTDVERLNPDWIVTSRGLTHTRELTVWEGIFPFASGCNIAFEREVFDAVGGFDDTLMFGQDVEFCLRVWDAGFTLGFAPDALVYYRYRATMSDSFRRARRYGAVRPRLAEELRRRGRPTPSQLAGVRNWLWLVKHLPKLATRTGRARWLWVAGQRVGNLEASIRVRRLYL